MSTMALSTATTTPLQLPHLQLLVPIANIATTADQIICIIKIIAPYNASI